MTRPDHHRKRNKHKKKSSSRTSTTITADYHTRKSDLISSALRTRNKEEIRLLALADGGLLTFRKFGWRLLLCADEDHDNVVGHDHHEKPSERELKEDVQKQIALDVARSFGGDEALSRKQAQTKREQLKVLLEAFFKRNGDLHYFQGFHDMGVVIMDLFEGDFEEQLSVLKKLSRFFNFRDAHEKDFFIVTKSLQTIGELMKRKDPEYAAQIDEDGHSFWAISMLITGFSHDVDNKEALYRLFDAIVASPPYFILYLVAAVALIPENRERVLQAEVAHEQLRKIVREIATVEQADHIVRFARDLTSITSPEELLSFAETNLQLPRASILLQPFPYDVTWVPPLPPYHVKVTSTDLQIVKLNSFALFWFKKYWVRAILVALVAGSVVRLSSRIL